MTSLAPAENRLEALIPRKQPTALVLLLGQQAQAVLDHDHRTVDDNAEVDGAKAHQIGADMVLHHAGDGEEHRQRNDAGRDEGCAEVAENQEQHDHDQQSAFEQILLDCPDCCLDKLGPVVDHLRHNSVRQRASNLVQLGANALSGRPAILADQQHRRADDGFLAVERRGARPQVGSFLDLRHVRNADGYSAACADDYVADLRQSIHLAGRADKVLLAVAFNVACADIRIVCRQRLHHIAESEAIGHQLRGIGQHVELLLVTADRVDLDNAWHRAELRLDDPILDRPQVRGRIGFAVRPLRPRLGFDRIHVDLAETS